MLEEEEEEERGEGPRERSGEAEVLVATAWMVHLSLDVRCALSDNLIGWCLQAGAIIHQTIII